MAATLAGTPTVSTGVNANVINVTLPGGVQSGEMLEIVVGTFLGANITTPSGWNVGIAQTLDAYGNTAAALFWKIASGTEGGTTVAISFSGLVNSTALAWRISGQGTTPVNASGTNTGVDFASIAMTTPSVTTTEGGCSIQRIAVTRGASDVLIPAGQTNIGYASSGVDYDNICIRAVTATQSSAGATGTVDLQTSDADRPWVAMTFAITAGAGGGGGGGEGGGGSPVFIMPIGFDVF